MKQVYDSIIGEKFNNLVASIKNYAYTGVCTQCLFKTTEAVVRLVQYVSYSNSSEKELLKILKSAPVPVQLTVNAAFMEYQGGIFNDTTCADGNIQKSLLLVGYGVENDQKYWIARNK